ncbi:MAG TPA: hypothetical protein DD990_34810, partial [Cyanobacteria bacterium UBA11368]|nr:hypothetical protein [Cyanobacteria bacterium UBA11368]
LNSGRSLLPKGGINFSIAIALSSNLEIVECVRAAEGRHIAPYQFLNSDRATLKQAIALSSNLEIVECDRVAEGRLIALSVGRHIAFVTIFFP